MDYDSWLYSGPGGPDDDDEWEDEPPSDGPTDNWDDNAEVPDTPDDMKPEPWEFLDDYADPPF